MALIFALLILLAAWSMRWAEAQGLITDGAERAAGVVLGLILIWMGNLMPKQVPDQCPNCVDGRAFAMRRFAGWMFIVCGVALGLMWIFAPLPYANSLDLFVIGGAVGLVLLRATITKTFV